MTPEEELSFWRDRAARDLWVEEEKRGQHFGPDWIEVAGVMGLPPSVAKVVVERLPAVKDEAREMLALPESYTPPPRAHWRCRLFGHRFHDPVFGHEIHVVLPSVEGSMGMPDERPDVCGCGAKRDRNGRVVEP